MRAAAYLRDNHSAPAILIGHSLGGAAVLVAAHDIPEARAVVTVNAPADVAHVLKNFGTSLEEVRDKGEAEVVLSGRQFRIRRSFIADAEQYRLADRISSLGKALLVMHAPHDAVVSIEHASKIFLAARHPKSFVSLDDADHLLSNAGSAAYAARVIEAWASKYIPEAPAARENETTGVLIRETGQGTYQNSVTLGRHRLIADEPAAAGGRDSGPSPYDYLSVALGACTSMTLRAYANYKNLALGRYPSSSVMARLRLSIARIAAPWLQGARAKSTASSGSSRSKASSMPRCARSCLKLPTNVRCTAPWRWVPPLSPR